MQKQKAAQVALEKKQATPKDEDAGARLRRVLDATNTEKPKQADIDELHVLLKEYPELWKLTGQFSDYAVNRLLEKSASQVLVRESAKQGLKVLKTDLGYERAPALEKILIENVAVCWLQLSVTQSKYELTTGAGVSIPSADYWERRLTQTQARYLRACETLARVRKLSQPGALQLNIGARQVNIAQGKDQSAAGSLPNPKAKTIEGERIT